MINQKTHKVGIYVRLSKESVYDEESLSIENQKFILMKHVRDNGWELVDIYCDDGFSGVNQDRPDLQRMLQDVKEGDINTILIKDLSWLGRNYIEMGELIESFLPDHDCELISLAEQIDDMTVFRNIHNEHHSRETSKKVKAVKAMLAKDGKFAGSFAPYGYKSQTVISIFLSRTNRQPPLYERYLRCVLKARVLPELLTILITPVLLRQETTTTRNAKLKIPFALIIVGI